MAFARYRDMSVSRDLFGFGVSSAPSESTHANHSVETIETERERER
jgi:hypothetical protein